MNMGKLLFIENPNDDVDQSARVFSIPSGISETNELLRYYNQHIFKMQGFGYNWDAFNDCICSFGEEYEIREKEIHIVHHDLPLSADLKARNKYIQIVEGAIRFWNLPEFSKFYSLTVSFPIENEQEVRAILDVAPLRLVGRQNPFPNQP